MKNYDVCNEKDAILFCGREVGRVNLTNITSDILNPVTLARLIVDTESLCKPLVTIDFSTIIQVLDTATGDEAQTSGIELSFELKKNCDGVEQILKEYKVIRYVELSDGASYNIRNSFAFSYCDDSFCSNACCVYTVQLVKVRLIAPGRIDQLLVEDSAINALAQGLCERSYLYGKHSNTR